MNTKQTRTIIDFLEKGYKSMSEMQEKSEPLTDEEKAQNGIITREYEKKKKWDCYRTPNDDCDGDLR